MMLSDRTRGFTLIELLVVIAIIGLLASVVLASLNSAREKGRDARRFADIKNAQLALELYYDEYGSYPARPSNDEVNGESNVCGNVPTCLPALYNNTNFRKYLSSPVHDPSKKGQTTNYRYDQTASGAGYQILMYHEGERPGAATGKGWCSFHVTAQTWSGVGYPTCQ